MEKYKIEIRFISDNIIERKNFPNDTFFIFDTTTAELFMERLAPENFFIIPSGEAHKNFSTIENILDAAIKKNLTRNTTFCAIGGGVVCDIVGFCASIYKRGVNLILVPTTLLAIVDAAIGGKTACNFRNTKNTLGTFYAPKKIFIWFDVLTTLSPTHFKTGLAEIIKIGLINEPSIIKQIQKESELNLKSPDLITIIKKAINAKYKIVQKDFREQNTRALLNFGHTFGHALESITDFRISHGEAVAWGIYQEIMLSLKLGLCNREYVEMIKKILLSFGFELAFFPNRYTTTIKDKNEFCTKLIEYMKHDKKNIDQLITFILPKKQNSFIKKSISEIKLLELIQTFYEETL